MSSGNKEKEALHQLIEAAVHEGRSQVLYLLLAIGDESVAHDHLHPARTQFLYETRVEIVHRLRNRNHWPKEWPDFERYTGSRWEIKQGHRGHCVLP